MSGEALAGLRRRVAGRQATVGVVGLGYVGLPSAALLAAAGFGVIGVDLKRERVDLINSGANPIEGDEPGLSELLERMIASERLRATTASEELAEADVVLVSVETPVAADHRPSFAALKAACTQIGRVLKPGALVIIESTIAPGTVAGLVRPALEESSGRTEGRDFHLGHCPERVMPGRLLRNMRTMSRVLGADSAEVAEVMRALYSAYVEGDLDPADLLTAELVKTAENAYRDVNIAFVNELAIICERSGADVWKVRELVRKSPGRDLLLPGSGVGGHCIPKDPWLLAAPLGDQADTSLLAAARRVNDGMPVHVAGIALAALRDHEVHPADAIIGVLGAAYLENSDDKRNSPTAVLTEVLARAGCRVRVHDPLVAGVERDLDAVVAGADCVIAMVAHSDYGGIDLAVLSASLRHPILVDTRRVFDAATATAVGLDYRRLGTGGPRPSAVSAEGDR